MYRPHPNNASMNINNISQFLRRNFCARLTDEISQQKPGSRSCADLAGRGAVFFGRMRVTRNALCFDRTDRRYIYSAA
jgi:hypothetical protein